MGDRTLAAQKTDGRLRGLRTDMPMDRQTDGRDETWDWQLALCELRHRHYVLLIWCVLNLELCYSTCDVQTLVDHMKCALPCTMHSHCTLASASKSLLALFSLPLHHLLSAPSRSLAGGLGSNAWLSFHHTEHLALSVITAFSQSLMSVWTAHRTGAINVTLAGHLVALPWGRDVEFGATPAAVFVALPRSAYCQPSDDDAVPVSNR